MSILQDEAALKTAQINLGYTDILSPIAGKIGKSAVTKGNVVSPSSGVLTSIVSQDPMYVLFPVSQRDLLRARENGQADASAIKCRLRFADGSGLALPAWRPPFDLLVGIAMARGWTLRDKAALVRVAMRWRGRR